MPAPDHQPDANTEPTNSSASPSSVGEHELKFLLVVKTFGHEEKTTKDTAKTILSRLRLALVDFELFTPDGDWRYSLDDRTLVVEPVIDVAHELKWRETFGWVCSCDPEVRIGEYTASRRGDGMPADQVMKAHADHLIRRFR